MVKAAVCVSFSTPSRRWAHFLFFKFSNRFCSGTTTVFFSIDGVSGTGQPASHTPGREERAWGRADAELSQRAPAAVCGEVRKHHAQRHGRQAEARGLSQVPERHCAARRRGVLRNVPQRRAECTASRAPPCLSPARSVRHASRRSASAPAAFLIARTRVSRSCR